MRWISYKDLAELLRQAGLPASPRTLRRWVVRYRVPVVRVNHRVVRIHGPTVRRVMRQLFSSRRSATAGGAQ
jgi:hypothetical protein